MLDSKVYSDLIETQKNASVVECWAIKDNSVIRVALTIKTVKVDHNRIVFRYNPYQFEYFNKIINGSRKIDFVIESKSLLFTCDFKKFDKENSELEVSLPLFFHYSDRRTDDRIIPNVDMLISLQGEKFPINASVYDLSRGGVSIVLGRELGLFLKEGKEFECDLKFQKQVFKVSVVVKNVMPFKAYEFDGIPFVGKRYSLVFQNPSASMLLKIDNMIKEQYLNHKNVHSH